MKQETIYKGAEIANFLEKISMEKFKFEVKYNMVVIIIKYKNWIEPLYLIY